MITRNTVLILGAGASMPYEYPSGYKLLKNICDYLKDPIDNKTMTLKKIGFDEKHVKEFRENLYYSGKTSVDAFLEWRPEYIEIGKAAIAIELIGYEKTDVLFNKNNPQDWYQYLFNKLNSSFEEFDKNNLSIITFNYDRSLEYYLYTALQNSYGKSKSECKNKIKNLQILHLHGILGYMPWQSQQYRDYFYGLGELEKIKESYGSIKVIHESIENDQEFLRAHKLLEEAVVVCFLGFGYNRTNLERLLFARNMSKCRNIFGTAYQMTKQECIDITNMFSSFNNVKLILGKEDQDTLLFLRNNPIF